MFNVDSRVGAGAAGVQLTYLCVRSGKYLFLEASEGFLFLVPVTVKRITSVATVKVTISFTDEN